MAEPWLSTGEKVTEFFSSEQIEASARRPKFVQRTSKMTGKLLLALSTFGRWGTAKTTVPRLAAKAAQLDEPVDITPEALQQRRTARAGAFWPDFLQTALAKLHPGDLIGEEGIVAPVSGVPSAARTGVGLPESLAKEFPGAGGSGSNASAKIHLGGRIRVRPSLPLRSFPGISPLVRRSDGGNERGPPRGFWWTWGTATLPPLPPGRRQRPISSVGSIIRPQSVRVGGDGSKRWIWPRVWPPIPAP
jgi:hypothetical protein